MIHVGSAGDGETVGWRRHAGEPTLLYVLAFLIGVTAGLRTMTPPAIVSWAARVGWLKLAGTPLAFLGAAVTPWIFTVAAAWELIYDKLPIASSRKAPGPFIARIVMGSLCGAAIGASASGGSLVGGLVAGALGAVAGTFGGYEFRARLARAAGRDLPIALLEDAIAIGLALFAVTRFR
jgi:uncharacterized membrane protein